MASALRVDFLADDADEGGPGADGRDGHRTQRPLRVDAATAPQHVALVGFLDANRDVTRHGVDVGSEQDAVIGWRADVADLVERHLAVVGLEELDQLFGRGFLVAGHRRRANDCFQQVAGLRVGLAARGFAHPTTSAIASTTASAWDSSMVNGGSRRTTVRPAGSASTWWFSASSFRPRSRRGRPRRRSSGPRRGCPARRRRWPLPVPSGGNRPSWRRVREGRLRGRSRRSRRRPPR